MRKRVISHSILILSITCVAVGLSGCWQHKDSPESGPRETAGKLSLMERFDVKPDGTQTNITTTAEGTLYVLAPQLGAAIIGNNDKASDIPAKACSLNSQPLTATQSDLNFPDPKGDKYVAFAEMKINKGGQYSLTCSESKTDRLLAVFESNKK